jgi:acyl-CoA thioesterase I
MLLRVRLYHVFFIAGLGSLLLGGVAHAATVVALGASNTFGKGVSRSQAYPAQLEALLRARGLSVRVINAGINGDTTGGMLARLDRVVPKGTNVVILQPGGNDQRKLAADNTSRYSKPVRRHGHQGRYVAQRDASRAAAPT